jgi:CRP-like cAMP-binding protein
MPMGNRAQLGGRIRFANLGDLFQVLGGNNCTGVLTLHSPHADTAGRIFFSDGNPVDARVGPFRGLEAVYALFGWSDGTFEFCQERVEVKRTIRSGRMEIVLDALRMLDDGVIARLGTSETKLLEPAADLPLIRGPFVDYGYIVHEETIPVGHTIVTEGSHGNWIWVILEGKVLISRETRTGRVPVARLGPGAFIGTFAALLFGECERTATVTAETDVHLALLDTYRLGGEFGSLCGELRKSLLHMSKRLREVTDEFVDWRKEQFTSFSFPVPTDLQQDDFPIDVMEEEYGRLSRTFKNLIHYLGTSIRVTGSMPGTAVSRRAPPG